jgi:hypothetical protein
MSARFAAFATALLVLLLAAPAAEAGKKKPKRLDGNAVISFKGVGQIKLGMTLKQARKAARRTISDGRIVTPGCRHDQVFPKRFGLSTLRFNGKIRVLYVTRTAMPTRRGVRVNDSLARLQSKYGSSLIERPSDVSPQTRIFELHGEGGREIQFSVNSVTNRIFQIATGLAPEVDFSEGCA